ncbi:MAG TPA: phosphoglycerate dehydrogenase [Oligoflexia bacterium]|nr:phosphoglycerate dehydrogenase [Oligoflexia bacterium]
MMVKIAVTSSSFSQNDILRKELSTRFPNVVFNEKGRTLTREETAEVLRTVDGAIIGVEKIDSSVLPKSDRLKILSKYGVGIDNIDFDACRVAGVEVYWKSGVNAYSVAEQTIGMILMSCRALFARCQSLKRGEWVKNGGTQLSSKTLGIIGLGNVGQKLVELLRPFGTKIIANDIEDRSDFCRKYGIEQVELDRVFRDSDIVSLHVPLTALTRQLVNAERLSLMKSSSLLVNTSRGAVVDQNALKKALLANIIGAAALDVYEEEPPRDLEFLSLPNLICTPHICGNSSESVLAMGRSAIYGLNQRFT